MSRPAKIILIAAGALASLIIVLAITAILIVRTVWFHDMVRERIVKEVETSTGGRAEIASFSFEWRRLKAEVRDFVLHGTEPAGAPPLFRAKSVRVGLKVVSALKRDVDISYLDIEQPRVHVMVLPDGSTNLPEPKVKQQSNKKPLETVVDLAIRRFVIDDGRLDFASHKTPFEARGENLRAQFLYEIVGQRYRGDISIKPLYVDWGKQRPLPLELKIPAVVERNGIQVSGAQLRSPESFIEITARLDDATVPRGSLRLNGKLSLAEVAPDLKVNRTAALALNGSLDNDRVQLASVNVALGRSRLDASGTIESIKTQKGSLRFNCNLAVGELGQIFKASGRPDGTVTLGGEARFRRTDQYFLTAELAGKDLAIDQGQQRLSGIQVASRISMNQRRAEANPVQVAALGGTFGGRVVVVDMDRYSVEGTLNNLALRQVARTYGSQPLVWDGTVAGPVHADGSIKQPKALRASARLGITPGSQGIPITGKVGVNYDARRDLIDLDNSFIATPSSRLDFSGSVGRQLQVRLVSRNLDDFLPAMAMASPSAPKQLPIALKNGTANLNATIIGKLEDPRVAGHASLTNFVYNGQQFDQFAADLEAQKSAATVRNLVLTQGRLQARADGAVRLRDWKLDETGPVTANASLRNADVQRLAAIAGQQKAPVTGTLEATAQVSGTVDDPRATLNAAVSKGSAYEEPFDRLQVTASYTSRLAEIRSGQLAKGPARLEFNGAFEHPLKDFRSGRARFHVVSNTIQLAQFQVLQRQRKGVTGSLQLNADGAATLQPAAGKPEILLTDLNAAVRAREVALDRKRLGDLTATAETQGSQLAFHLQSDFANSDIKGNGTWQLSGDYPVNALVTFSPVKLSYLREWLATSSSTGQQSDFDGVVEGKIQLAGPVRKPDALKGSLELSKLEFGATAKATEGAGTKRKPVSVHNQGPILITLDRSAVRVQSARLVGTATDIELSGTVTTRKPETADLRVKGSVGLELIQAFNPDVLAAGNIVINSAVRGPVSQPTVDGRVRLNNASLNMVDAPNGISNANGVIAFTRYQAAIENITAESGGGKITLNGTVAYGGKQVGFRLDAKADHVRVRYPEGASTLTNANLTLAGTTEKSLLSGTITILETGFHPRTDFASILAQSAQPAQPETAKTGPLGGLGLDVRIETSPDIQFQTSLAQNIQAEANLRLRGTASRPGMLGRISITEGELVFFGSKYTINQGTISFFNPQKIDPVLNIDLETKARGIDVILTLTGPMDHLQITHRSDPPLQFSEIVSLLAMGKMPTSDPALLAQQPAEPQQSWEQMGASVLGQAIASPVSGRLQRLFGVSKLKFDPQISGVVSNPQARLTLEQQVTRDITFTYIQDVTQSNPQVVRVEWAMSRQWSAIAVREENGRFGVDFLYKKRLR